jgi:hypothetical protein
MEGVKVRKKKERSKKTTFTGDLGWLKEDISSLQLPCPNYPYSLPRRRKFHQANNRKQTGFAPEGDKLWKEKRDKRKT